ncbi:MAG: NUMOD3 domain-containing DNA-binding protein [Elusimicrobia bacterium]|nr:NUMOD3 domain-containing DNA-binding protein [Elusimicrobiota bacterium]
MPPGIYKHKPNSEEQNKKISEALKGRHLLEETKRKISKWHKGKHHSDETRRKISESHKGSKNYLYGKHLSEETKKKMSEVHKRENNPNWKGCITPENDRIRKSREFRLWREAVLARDNYTCQKCGQKGGKLQSHHIFNFATYLDLRFAIDNGITLCKDCHSDFHKRYGIKNNTREQLKEFLLRGN